MTIGFVQCGVVGLRGGRGSARCSNGGVWMVAAGYGKAEAYGSDVSKADSGPLRLEGCDLYLPEEEITSIVHFTPGALVSSQPHLFYGNFLSSLSDFGIAIISTPYDTSFDHLKLGKDVATKYVNAYAALLPRLPNTWVPTFGMGHSLGAKLQVLMNCVPEIRQKFPPRASNVLISYNNFDSAESIPAYENIIDGLRVLESLNPLLNSVGVAMGVDLKSSRFRDINIEQIFDNLRNFTGDVEPPTSVFESMVQRSYAVPDNCVISFATDSIDQSDILEADLRSRHGKRTVRRPLAGTHLTPMMPASDELKDFGLGRDIQNYLQETVQSVRTQYDREFQDLVVTTVAFLRLMEEDCNRRLLGTGHESSTMDH
eukprot:CAMPEP_0184747090 /NCGR_PEP_ID=MMETSP0315-20130426/9487_1 /TAXON_ID=101924 /ORGANISM="Rhodosorus marinus, Strain UTEX LB 2760" /LENGTH=370 /DNA_ID=CAMNT_0027219855 /DNA_START=168 /DNA_END=1280 /DNA_ORIENTATION=+